MPAVLAKPVKKAKAAAMSSASASAFEVYVSQLKQHEQISALSAQGMQQKGKVENLQRYNRHLEQERDADRREAQRWRQDLIHLQNLDHNQKSNMTHQHQEIMHALRSLCASASTSRKPSRKRDPELSNTPVKALTESDSSRQAEVSEST
jgi:hypothetical protein